MTRGDQLNTIANPLQKHAEKMHQTPLQSAFSTIPRGGGTLQSIIQARSADDDPCPDFRDCLGVGSPVRHCPVGAFRHRLRATLWEVRPSWFPVGSQGRVLHPRASLGKRAPTHLLSPSVTKILCRATGGWGHWEQALEGGSGHQAQTRSCIVLRQTLSFRCKVCWVSPSLG